MNMQRLMHTIKNIIIQLYLYLKLDVKMVRLIVPVILLAFTITTNASSNKNEVKKLLTQLDSVLYKSEANIKLFNSHNDSIKFIYANNSFRVDYIRLLANKLTDKQHYKRAIELIYISMLMQQSKKDINNLAKSYLILGNIYAKIPMRDMAIKKYNEALSFSNKKDSLFRSEILYLLAKTEHQLFNYKKANEYFNRARLILPKDIDIKLKADYLHFQGILYQQADKYQEALICIDSAIAIDIKLNNWRGHAVNLTSKGNVYSKMVDYANATKYFEEAYNMELKYGNSYPVVKAINLGSAYINMREFHKMFTLYKEVEKHINRDDPRTSGSYYHNMSIYYDVFDSSVKSKLYADSAYNELIKSRNFNKLLGLKKHELGKAIIANNKDKIIEYYQFIDTYKGSLFIHDAWKDIHKAELEKEISNIEHRFNIKYLQNVKRLKNLSDTSNTQYIIIIVLLITVLIILSIYIITIKKKSSILVSYKSDIATAKEDLQTIHNQFKEIKNRSDQVTDELNRFIHINNKVKEYIESSITALQPVKNAKEATEHLKWCLDIINESGDIRFNLDSKYIELKASIKSRFPALNENDERLCLLLKLNFSMKEIATFMNISPRSVETARYRLRKKLGFESNEELIATLHKL